MTPQPTPPPIRKDTLPDDLMPKPETPLMVIASNGAIINGTSTLFFFQALTSEFLIVRESKLGATFWLRRESITGFYEIMPELAEAMTELARNEAEKEKREKEERAAIRERIAQREASKILTGKK